MLVRTCQVLYRYYPYYEGFDVVDFLCRWFRLVCYNLPFAYFSQMFFVQPFVRFAIRRIFPANIAQRDERNATKTVKPAARPRPSPM